MLALSATCSVYSQQTNGEPTAPDPATIRNSEQTAKKANDSAAATNAERPAYKSLRYDEDYSFLGDETNQIDYLDRLKYIGLGRENWYVSIGGEICPFYERFRNENFGAVAADDNGFWLQRYMLHADWHLGKRVRVFSQIKKKE